MAPKYKNEADWSVSYFPQKLPWGWIDHPYLWQRSFLVQVSRVLLVLIYLFICLLIVQDLYTAPFGKPLPGAQQSQGRKARSININSKKQNKNEPGGNILMSEDLAEGNQIRVHLGIRHMYICSCSWLDKKNANINFPTFFFAKPNSAAGNKGMALPFRDLMWEKLRKATGWFVWLCLPFHQMLLDVLCVGWGRREGGLCKMACLAVQMVSKGIFQK